MSFKLLHIEDNFGDIELVKEALNGRNVEITVASDGQQAMDMLKLSKNDFNLILLDLNIPAISGLELLKYIRNNPDWKYTPVVVFSTSRNPTDIQKALDGGANSYRIKEADVEAFFEGMTILVDYWSSMVTKMKPQ